MKEAHRRKRHRQKLSKRDIWLAQHRRWLASLPPVKTVFTELPDQTLVNTVRSWVNLLTR